MHGAPAVHDAAHAYVDPVGWQMGNDPGHALHAPHVDGDERSASQPSLATPLQSAYPGRHMNEHALPPTQLALACGGAGHALQRAPHVATALLLTQAPLHRWKPASQTTPHTPAVHDGTPFVGTGQMFPHVPQLSVSDCGSTQFEPHCIGVGAVHDETHPYAPLRIPHRVPPVHCVVQAPQFWLVVRSVSQPFASTPSQSPRFGSQAIAHIPTMQVPRAVLGIVVQSLPHVPQFCALLDTSTHTPPHRTSPVPQGGTVSVRSFGTSAVASTRESIESLPSRDASGSNGSRRECATASHPSRPQVWSGRHIARAAGSRHRSARNTSNSLVCCDSKGAIA